MKEWTEESLAEHYAGLLSRLILKKSDIFPKNPSHGDLYMDAIERIYRFNAQKVWEQIVK